MVSKDSSIDPVGACVGMRGSRVQAVVNELSGEKIDIIPWSPDPATFVVNALAPAEVSKVVLDEDSRRIEVIVPDAQLSLAIGRRGQNVRLASQLTGWDIDIVTESEDAERRSREFKQLTEYFVEALNVEEVIAQLLVTEGFTRVDELVYVELDELASIQGFDENIAQALRERAETYLAEQHEALRQEAAELGLGEDLLASTALSLETIVALGRKGIKSLDDLADLAADELIELLPDGGLSEEDAGQLIMAARAHWFGDAEAAADGAAPAESGRGDRRRGAGGRRRRSRARGRGPATASGLAERGGDGAGAHGPARRSRRHAALPGDPRGAAARGTAALRARPRGPGAARRRGAPAGSRYVVERRADVVNKAVAKNLFARAARAPAQVAADLGRAGRAVVGAACACHIRVGAARRAGRGGLRAGARRVALADRQRCCSRRATARRTAGEAAPAGAGSAVDRRVLECRAGRGPGPRELGTRRRRAGRAGAAAAAGRGAAGGLPQRRDRAADSGAGRLSRPSRRKRPRPR